MEDSIEDSMPNSIESVLNEISNNIFAISSTIMRNVIKLFHADWVHTYDDLVAITNDKQVFYQLNISFELKQAIEKYINDRKIKLLLSNIEQKCLVEI
jgi:hypothetical protein